MSDLLPKIKEISRLFEIVPSRSKGQNFLINEHIYDEIVKAADLKPTDTVLEIGPGLGFLTAKLAAKVKQVIAVELDDKLAAYLKMATDAQAVNNITIINEDILRANLKPYLSGPYKIVANLPYNITSIFLRHFLTSAAKPELMVLMLQKEVAERIVATPPDMSILAVSVQYYGAPEIIREVKAGNFWPAPEVDSAIIKIVIPPLPRMAGAAAEKRFFQLVKIGFSAKRKMLKNNLAAGLKISPSLVEKSIAASALNPKIRAEDLSLDDWQKLFDSLSPFVL